ncbi:MAG: F0F1 ATP synthase subunit delta [Bacillota bacterium]|nr:F0F1 ATP synthase subunit delta [Bacillota bacterium]
MIQHAIARRYADALFHVAQEHGKLDEVAADLQLLLGFLTQEPDLKELLGHQRISIRRKKEIVRNLWQSRISRLVLGFLELLVDKRRERYLEDIVDVYLNLLRATRNIAVADVKTAYPLDPEMQVKLKRVLETVTRKNIELKISVEPDLIGGLVVKVGDRIFDGSVTKRLELLGARLTERSLGKLEVGSE